MDLDGKSAKRFRLQKVAERLLARRQQEPMLTRIYGTGTSPSRKSRRLPASDREARSAITERSARDGPLPLPGGRPARCSASQRAGPCSRKVAYMRRPHEGRTIAEVNAPQLLDKSLWATSATGAVPRERFMAKSAGDEPTTIASRDQADELPGTSDLQARAAIVSRVALRFAEFGICNATSRRARGTG